MFDYNDILENVPHRYPFLLIDKVIDFKADESVTAVKNVSFNEAQFDGHFPGKPVLPGVYIIENMAQTACFLLAKSAGGVDKDSVYFLGKVGKVSFIKPVFPGDQLTTTVTVERRFGASASVLAKAQVNGKTVAKGELMFGVRPGA